MIKNLKGKQVLNILCRFQTFCALKYSKINIKHGENNISSTLMSIYKM